MVPFWERDSGTSIRTNLCLRSSCSDVLLALFPFGCGPVLTRPFLSFMDPLRPLADSSPGARGSMRSGVTPSSSDPGQSSYSSQPSLPSIRQLHPYLPPSGLSQHYSSSGEGSSYMYPAPPQFTPHPSPPDQPLLSSRKSSEMFGIDSEVDDMEQSRGPPKKKRRRQALSCTGFLDFLLSQPCAPCTRRGEQSRCQWHIVEPVEKYVTRTEFDELKARYDELYEQVQRLQAATQGPPYYQMGISPGAPGAPVEAVPSFPATGPLAVRNDSSNPRIPKPHLATITAQLLLSDINGAEKLTIFTCIYHVAIPSGHPVKKLPRADAHAGAASAPRISGSRRPSGSIFRDDPTPSNPPTVTGTLSEIYIDNPASSSSQPTSAIQMQPPSRRFMDSPLPPGPSSRDDDRESITHFVRDR
ncbi:hypothetical protein D9615_003193 [Tricholomella constricta]|uniref:Uncharacterized protein n=1 Tax=Tricholomella constricta TaxID=117010 RepID=A0A8H5HIX0_9AGAR|nr:hypothetical protein D9615_003193 [Tricholomella constricta]